MPIKFIELGDIGMAVGLAILGSLSWLMSVQGCSRFAARFAHLNASTLSADRQAVAALSGYGRENTAALLQQLGRHDLFATTLALREHRPGAIFPNTTVEGAQHLQRSLQAGNGTILWVAHVTHGALGVKVALDRAGFPVRHLSHPRHGFSATRCGRVALNWLRTRVEDRYLRERILVDESDPKAVLVTLQQRLEENEVVSITARGDSRNPVMTPFMQGQLALAPGAAVLALKSGARVLPVTAFDASNGLRVHIGPPIPEIRRSSVASVTRAYARWTERVVTRDPEHWLGWLHL